MPSSYLHYKIIEKLGEGGMGIVYLAQDTKLKRKVALKFLPTHISVDQDERKRFRQEARSAASLNHPNIAHVHAIEEADNEAFIVMEYVNGQDLKDLIETETLSLEQKIEIAFQIANGLNKAHSKGIIHRDIKSRNVMVDVDGNAKIMDFGLAHIQGGEHLTKSGMTLGTTSYMSPEQLRGEEANKQSDIWSLGVVLYELFTGEMPFKGMYEPAIMYSITEEDPDPVTTLNEEIPEGVASVIKRCLEKEKADRYQDLDALVSDLTNWQILSVADGKDSKRPSDELLSAKKLYTAIPVLIMLALILFWGKGIGSIFGNSVPEKKYLAVLPIENIGNHPEMKEVTAGLAEIFSYRLSELEKYQRAYWVAPASEMRKENITTASQANKLLGVNLAILSSLQVINDTTRLILELVDAENIRRIDTEQVVVASQNLADLERKGIKAMLNMLDIDLSDSINRSLEDRPTVESDAYELYLKGLASLRYYTSADSLDHAIALFNKSIDRDGSYSLSYAGLGEAYWRKYELTREFELVRKASFALNNALKIDKDLAPVQAMMGQLKAGTGDTEEALKYFNRALEIDPKYSAAYRGLASIYGDRGGNEKAVDTYHKAINLKTDYWAGYKDLARYYLEKGKLDSALKYFSKVAEITPNNSSAYVSLAGTYYLKSDLEKARSMAQKALGLEKNPRAANILAGIYFYQAKYNEAANMFRIVAEASPDVYEYWGNVGSAYEQAGDSLKSRKAYLTAIEKALKTLEIQRNQPEVLADLAAYYVDVNENMNALSYIQKALEVSSDNTLVKQRAIFVYESLGMRSEALKHISPELISYVESQPELRELKNDPEFKALKKKFAD